MDSASGVRQFLLPSSGSARKIMQAGGPELIAGAATVFPKRASRHAALVLILFVLFFRVAGLTQENSGRIGGTITDETGAVVPDAKITATSPTMPRAIETISDNLGRYSFPVLPIGVYSIAVTRQGFQTVRQHGIEVKLGSEITYNVSLALGPMAETVEVSVAAESLDITSSQTSTNINHASFDNLAKSRDYISLLLIAPGVRIEDRAGGGYGIQVDGASGSENAYIIDGVEVTNMFQGSLLAQYAIPLQLVQEVQIKSGGFESEYGGATGGVINIATRSGTNTYHGNFEFQFTNDILNPRPRGYWQRSPLNAGIADFYADKEDSYRTLWPGGRLGGPILKNRLLFTLAYEPTLQRTERDISYNSGAQRYTREDIQHYGLARLDFNPLDKWQFHTSWMWAPARSQGRLPSTDIRLPAPTNDQSVLGGFTPAQSYTASTSFAPSGRLLLTARYGYRYLNQKDGNYGLPGDAWIQYFNSSSNATGVPAEFAGPNGYQNISNPFKTEKNIQTRHNVYLDGSLMLSLAGQQHILKAGYALNRMSNDIVDDFPNGHFVIFWGESFSRGSISGERGAYGYYAWEDGVRHNAQVIGHNQGFYLQDNWRAATRLTLNLGVRFENEFLPPYRKEQGGIKIANPVSFGWGEKVAPRLGAAWDLKGDGTWKVSGSFGLFYDVMKYDVALGAFGGETYLSNYYRLDNPNVKALSKANPGAGGALIARFDNRLVPLNAAGQLAGLDPNLKPYSMRQFIARLDHRLTRRITAGVRYTHNDLLHVIEDIGVLGADNNSVFLYGNPGEGLTRNDPRHVFDGKTPNGQEFLVPKAKRQYDGIEFRLGGRLNNLMWTASYTWSRLFGNYSGLANSDESGRSAPSVTGAFDLPYYYFDSSGSQKNAYGLLATDRPHVLKWFGNYSVKSRAGETNAGLNQIVYSGLPDSSSVIYLSAPTFPFGRGDMGRTPVLTQTDLAVSHAVKTGERTYLKFDANALNVFNQAAVIGRVTLMNRGNGVISSQQLPVDEFFRGYDVRKFVFPGSQTPPWNPIYGLPGGHYRLGGPGAYQPGRLIRLGASFNF